jgi:hypothetical protein
MRGKGTSTRSAGSGKNATWSPPLATLPPDERPGAIERRFRQAIGAVNPSLVLLDTALRDFEEARASSPDGVEFLRARARARGHRLFGDRLSLPRARQLLFAAELGLLLSELDALCTQLRRHQAVNPAARDQKGKGDYVRRTVLVLLQSRVDEELSSPIEDEWLHSCISPVSIAIFDYYRSIRNTELHALRHDELGANFAKIDLTACRAEYGEVPSAPARVRFKDIVLASKVIQSIARSLCRAIFDPQRDLKAELVKRFGALSAERRRNGARAALAQDYLLDDTAIDVLLDELAWEA